MLSVAAAQTNIRGKKGEGDGEDAAGTSAGAVGPGREGAWAKGRWVVDADSVEIMSG